MNGTDSIARKKIVIFDLDGTLTKSKSNIDKEMAALISQLFRGGNEYIMRSTGVRCLSVSGPMEIKRLMRRMIRTARVN